MKVAPDRLAANLAGGPAPVYLVSGDEPLQLDECCDAIRKAARDAGYATREVFEAGPGFDWQRLAASAAALSLFADRKLIDVRVPSGKPGSDGARALAEYCGDPPPECLLLLTLPRLDRRQQASKWFRAVDSAGVVVQVWPVEPERLPGWIRGRLQQCGIEPTEAAVRTLAERVEGNLLAARQEIDKLLLLHGPGPLDEAQLSAAVVDSARYDVFELDDSALRGETARAVHVLDGLRAEGTAAPVVLWALHREAAQLAQIAVEVGRGASPEQAIGRAGVFRRRVGLVRRALSTRRAAAWLELLSQCHEADRAIKGLGGGQPWLALESLVVALGGRTGERPGTGRAGPR